MAWNLRVLVLPAFLSGGLFAIVPAGLIYAGTTPGRGVRAVSRRARESDSADAPSQPGAMLDDTNDLPFIDVLEGLRSGQLSANAEGTGDGRMTLNLTNRTQKKLRVVLPPGLLATGASGQFGGMGGMRGGMGGMGGGMGGMGGGMGGMGGGMGGMGGRGMGGMGGRGGMSGGTMPASMGMMMLGRLIMSLVGDRDSWDQKSLMSGMMMGMGGMGGGMGGMGGGMGGMGGGMGGMMGGGFRSVPPTGLPETTLEPKQTRHLPTALVSLNDPGDSMSVKFPAKGEKLAVGAVDRLDLNPRTQLAIRRLAMDKAPQALCQLVLWHTAAGIDWPKLTRISQPWANNYELALARQFVDQLDEPQVMKSGLESGTIYWEVRTNDLESVPLAAKLRTRFEKSTMLGLRTKAGIPASPTGPAIAFRAAFDRVKGEIQVASTDGQGAAWLPLGSFTLKLEPRSNEAANPSAVEEEVGHQATAVADSMALGILGRLVRCRLAKGETIKGKKTYKIRIDNGSPLILNGLTLGGSSVADADIEVDEPLPSTLAGFSLPPKRSWTVSVAADTVDRLNLKKGIDLLAADLSGL